MSKTLHLHYPPECKEDVWRHYRLKTIAHCLRSTGLKGLTLDIGCNDCSIAGFLKPRCHEYIGIDLSISALKKGKPHKRLEGDACSLPLKDDFADVVICSEVIEHLEDPRLLMKEIARVLRSHGKLVISTPNRESIFSLIQNSLHVPRFHDWKYVESHFQAFSPTEFDGLLEEHGFLVKRKMRFVAFPPFKITKQQYPFRIFHTLSRVVPEDSQELLIRVAVKKG